MNFRFETKCLETPASTASTDATAAEVDIEALQEADMAMGRDLDSIFDIMESQANTHFKATNVIIEHNWNEKEKKFAELTQ